MVVTCQQTASHTAHKHAPGFASDHMRSSGPPSPTAACCVTIAGHCQLHCSRRISTGQPSTLLLCAATRYEHIRPAFAAHVIGPGPTVLLVSKGFASQDLPHTAAAERQMGSSQPTAGKHARAPRANCYICHRAQRTSCSSRVCCCMRSDGTLLCSMTMCTLLTLSCCCLPAEQAPVSTHSSSASFAVSVDVMPTRHSNPGPMLLTSFPSTCAKVQRVRSSATRQDSGVKWCSSRYHLHRC
jgi:hypothetical protein